MRKVLVDLNKNLVTLNGKFAELAYMFYDKQMRKVVVNLISRYQLMFADVMKAIQSFKWEKVTELLLTFLDEADSLLDDLSWWLEFKAVEKITIAIRELLKVIRAQVIFIDQYRQSRYGVF